MKLSLVNLVPLKEGGAYGMSSKELAATYSLKMLQQMKDELFADQNHEAGQMDPDEFERLGRHQYYGGQLNGIEAAIALKQPKKDVPYPVATGEMTQDEYDKMMSTVKPDRASFEKSSKFDRMNEDKELTDYQKSIAAKWDNETKEGGSMDTGRELEKNDVKQFNINVDNKVSFLTKLRDDGRFKSTKVTDDKIEGWSIKPKIPGFKIAGMLKPEANEGSCGYGPDGVPGDTPGGTKGMNADDRTRGMLKMLIQKEIAKYENK
jgi:hypothetical protein